MRWLIVLLFSASAYSQVLTQTFTDRCTGQVKTVQIQMQGTTTVAFYNQVQTFTAQDFYSGAVKAWMEKTYAWWYNLSPCSTAQTTQTTATTSTNTANNSSSSTDNSSNNNSDNSGSSGSSDNSDSGGSDSGGDSGDNGSDSDGGGSDDDGGGSDDGGGDDDGGDDNDNDNDNEEKEEEQEQEEEQEEEEQEEESEEEEEEEESDEEEEESEEEEKKKRNPILISANLMAMSGLDGTLSNIASFGYSQTALNGVDSYSANLMIWDNLKQFTLGGAKSHIIYNYDRPIDFIIRENGKEYKFGTFYGKGSIHSIQSISLSTMYMYGIVNISTGLSNVYIRNGLIAGYSLSNNVLFGNGNYTIMPSASFFGTKPYKVNRFTISPMVALALNPIYFSSIEDKIGYNEHVVGVLGANFDFPLTENFKANIGGNIVKSTDNFPLTYSITIGAKFKLY
jgi:hypothetical protein|tara:strand:+ start:6407 stop:7759 length:1353 start_codon:yes stop_codon:yes gene_type:complete